MNIFIYLCTAFIMAQSLYSKPPTPLEINKELEVLETKKKTLFASIASELRCPTCTGLSILQSDAPFSLQIRSKVLDLVKEGKSSKEIKTFFHQRYGLWIFRSPPAEGFHWLAWLSPIIIFIFAILLLLRRFAKNKPYTTFKKIKTRKQIMAQMKYDLDKFKGTN